MWRRLLVVTGLAALAAWLLRRQRAIEATAGPDPSEELRRRLDEARRREEEVQAVEPERAADEAPDLDRRRQDVHARARAAADEMRSEPE